LTEWLLDNSNQGGCYFLNLAIANHPDQAKDFVATVGKFCDNVQDISTFFMDKQITFFPDVCTFFGFLNDIVPLFIQYLDKEDK